MDPFHERLARTGLRAADRYGFALAGGYAVQAAGLVERPSEDIDLFTAWDRRNEFTAAVTAVVHAYRDDGLTVETERQYLRPAGRHRRRADLQGRTRRGLARQRTNPDGHRTGPPP
ncbi:nucleotidyl transferase AbiEii/AbiGii toxin family protein [Micromonospora fiedleri]|uniref:Nucleotidyl transferase AbiEii/AbiGii toxin family protein n=1 Tax=Micromonospora fiedleri TaxID=1157498 RepID=A0ABS1UUU0_9ACTN|nr:nucleotidyl transferase AbiEii/AbiGii toxin family protein [Micromonospora fiedleri]